MKRSFLWLWVLGRKQTDFSLFQRDSYCVVLDTKVVSCEPAKGGSDKKSRRGGGGKGGKGAGDEPRGQAFDVVLEDTILFAKAGGQPSDAGTINGCRVSDVRVRDGTRGNAPHNIVHTVLEEALEAGAAVRVAVDWARRFDHMQQHTAQHLLTGIAADPRKAAAHCADDPAVAAAFEAVSSPRALETVGWELGPERCSVELSVADGALSGAEVELLEALANAAIRQHSAVHADEYRDRSALPAEMRSRGDVPCEGALRVVTIEGVDAATCCGTHVRNTAELQCVKLVGTERGRAHTTRVLFVAGGRVQRALGACLEREHALGVCFACAPERFAERVEALFAANSALKRDVQRLEAALAARDAEALAARAAHDEPVWAAGLDGMARVRVVAWHSSGATMSVLQQLVEQLTAAHAHALPADSLLVLTATTGSTQAGPGCYLVTLLNGTNRDYVKRVGEEAARVLVGKGGGKGLTVQGKAEQMERVPLLLEKLTHAPH